jgi:tRNA pseudouridine38-40 synthase
MASPSVALVLQYDGGAYAGWQFQPNARTVQGEVEGALERLVGRRLRVVGAGRTDAGVHALGQVAATAVPDRWSPEMLARALNGQLPDDVWVSSAARMTAGFDPRRHALERTYCYRLGTDAAARGPFRRRWEWAVPQPLDEGALLRAAAELVGTHDFRALSAVGPERSHWRCRVSEAVWQAREDAPGWEFWITADRFLHKMVRFLVGTMLDIARGRRPPTDLARLLRGHDNRLASPPAPPHGLFLVAVRYPGDRYADLP